MAITQWSNSTTLTHFSFTLAEGETRRPTKPAIFFDCLGDEARCRGGRGSCAERCLWKAHTARRGFASFRSLCRRERPLREHRLDQNDLVHEHLCSGS